MEPTTTFLNVDLDVKSRNDLRPLVEALGREVLPLQEGRLGRRYWIRIELARRAPKSPVDAIRRFCHLLSKLPPGPKALWDGASVRELDIGIQAGEEPVAAEWVLDTDAFKEAANLGAQIRITVYSPVLRTGPAPDLSADP
jgi:hypothetical protein